MKYIDYIHKHIITITCILMYVFAVFNNTYILDVNDDGKLLLENSISLSNLRNNFSKYDDMMYLEISSINVYAPINLDIDTNKLSSYEKVLKNGVAHAKGSSLPGYPGTTVVFGHSSSDNNTKYSNIFYNLNDLQINDELFIHDKWDSYKYKIIQKQIVKSDYINVTKTGDNNVLKIVSCYPPGTTWSRVLISAVQII